MVAFIEDNFVRRTDMSSPTFDILQFYLHVYLSFFLLVLSPWSDSLLIIGWFFQAENSGYPVTRICTYVVYELVFITSHSSALAPLHSAPLEPLALLSASRVASPSMSVSDSDSDSFSDPLAFAFYQSITFWSHYLIVTLAPPRCVAPRKGTEAVALQYTAQPCSAFCL